jgi:hypothetical protein
MIRAQPGFEARADATSKPTVGRRVALVGVAGLLLTPLVYTVMNPVTPRTRVRPIPPLPPLPEPMLSLPARAADAITGSALVQLMTSESLQAREDRVIEEVLQGNVPDFLRRLAPVELEAGGHRAVVWVAPDYLAVGSDDDFLRMPLRPSSAQRIADACQCLLPTTRIVDAIFTQATVRHVPLPLPTDEEMATVPAFASHQRMVERGRVETAQPLGELAAGHKKDVVLAPDLAGLAGRVVIYGWHQPDGVPLQSVSTAHLADYVDYSHGIRLVSIHATVDGTDRRLDDLLADPELSRLVSDDGPYRHPRYRT